MTEPESASSWSFVKAMMLPEKLTAPDDDAQEHRDRGDDRLWVAAERLGLVELRERDERRRRAADTVEGGDHLGHRRHLDPLGRDGADHRSHENPDQDPDRSELRRCPHDEDRRDERYDHPDGG